MLIIELILLVVLLVVAYSAGRRKIAKMPKHVHAWGEWQQSTIRWCTPQGVFLYHRGIQTRNCLGCNYYEREYT